jgi:hypothetical protein
MPMLDRPTRSGNARKMIESKPFAQGRPSLVAKRWPCTTGLTSYLSSRICLTAGRRLSTPPNQGLSRKPSASFGLSADTLAHPANTCSPFAFQLRRWNLSAAPLDTGQEHLPTLAHSSNYRPFQPTVLASRAKTEPMTPDSTRGMSLPPPL